MNSIRRDFLDTLHCPYSGTRFNVHSALAEQDSGIGYGIVTSEGGDFPIVDGILRLRLDAYREPLVDLIRRREPRQALLTALDTPFYGCLGPAIHFLDYSARRTGFGRIARGLTALKQPMYRAVTDARGTLVDTMKRLRTPSWATWQIQRFSMPHFLPVYPLLHLLDGRGPVLDFGCGGGHASFLMSRRVAGSSITCADVGFHGLFLTRQFLVGDANFICLDGDYPLPFASGYFSHVFSSDVLHWIDSKLGLAREFCRVVSWEGVIILPHLHNNLAPVRAGKSLSPAGYDGLFQDMERRLIPEDVLVDQFVTSGTVDLEKEWTREQLQAAANGLSLVASRNAAVFRRYDGLWQRCTDCMTPALNPLYEISGRRGKWNLSKPPAHSAGKPAPGDNLYLPHAVSLEVPYLDRQSLAGLKTADRRTFDELAKRFVLIDAPLSFSAFLLSVSLKSSWAATSRLLTSDLWGCVPDLLALAA